ncbi:MAG TPA: hypothetical protein VLE53_16520 [Gemmatimonadaceae bacterium]|nr:hypothetical protein [Gemmatimonadaceae bacterium]
MGAGLNIRRAGHWLFRVTRVAHASRASLAAASAMALTACDGGVAAPEAPAAPLSGTVALVAQGVGETRVRAGEYAYLGCLSGYQPRVCIPATLEVLGDGRWFFRTYVLFTTPQHPSLSFFVFDLWHWASRNTKCDGGGDPSYLFGSCPAETRFTPSMTFDTWVDVVDPSQPPPPARQRVTWYYKPGTAGF